MIGAHLARAIAAARQAARPLYASETGGRQRRRDDVAESWWHYPPSSAVMAESERVLAEAGLLLFFGGATIQRQLVCTRWVVQHLESGEHLELVWEAPPFADSETATHAILGTVRHAERAVRLVLLGLPVVRHLKPGEHAEAGIVVIRPGVLDREEAALPAWADPATAGDVWDQEPAAPEPEAIEAPPELAPPELAEEADAAARGEVVEPLDVAALYSRLCAWRRINTGNPRELAGVPISGPLAPADLAALDAWLKGQAA